MKRINKISPRFYLFLFGPLILSAQVSRAQDIASLISAEGRVEQSRSGSSSWEEAKTGNTFALKDRIRTLIQSRAGIRFRSGYLARMRERTTLTFTSNVSGPDQRAGSTIGVAEGTAYFFSREPKEFPEIVTPHVSASVRGTEFVVDVTAGGTTVTVLAGNVQASNRFGTLDLVRGEQAVVREGQAPVKQIVLHPEEAVQWAAYFPALLHPEQFGTSDAGRALIASNQHFSTGQIEEAQKELTRAEQLLPNADPGQRAGLAAAASALAAFSELLKNHPREAAELAAAARKHAPNSSAALLVSSYVAQSEGNIKAAKGYLERAAAASPKNSFVLARLAEVQLGLGEEEQAESTLQKALALNAGDTYALSVLGFLKLARHDTAAASQQFNRALSLDQSLALPHVGLGLANMKEGDLQAGRSEFERAVQLDPTVSIYRSYLGKSFYEEDREHLAEKEYGRAIELDPNDPTPYLYRAYAKLATHRPLEALKDVETSVEKNDNRSVYRSRLLLDQDLATRAVSLGRIYSRVGFSELARVNAVQALSKNASDYSAHYLLSDLSRQSHFDRRTQVTENLLGRLLSPPSFNSNNFTIGGEPSINEYTPLFDRPLERAHAEIAADSQINKISGIGDYTFSGESLGMRTGYAGAYRDGFRDNDWSREHQIFNLGQYQLAPDDTLIWDGALTIRDQGDTIVDFDPRAEDEDFQSKFDGALIRGGYHHRFGPGSNLIAQVFYNYGTFDVSDVSDTRLTFLTLADQNNGQSFPFNSSVSQKYDTEQHLGRADVQYLWDSELVSVVAGGSTRVERLESEDDGSRIVSVGNQALGFLAGSELATEATTDQLSHREYLYSTWHLHQQLDFTGGIVYSYLKLNENALQPPFVDQTYTKDQWGPKAGLVLRATPTTTVRASYSRGLDDTGRFGIGALEPTFVGGFNQLFDSVQGSTQDFYGAGVDQRLLTNTYVGASYQRRELDLSVPRIQEGIFLNRADGSVSEVFAADAINGGATSDRVTSYWYQIITDRISTALDYDYEFFDEDDPLPNFKTNRVGIRANYFDPSGFFSLIQATYRHQQHAGAFDPRATEDFWICDAGAGYEFEHRTGAISLNFQNIFDRQYEYSSIPEEQPIFPRFGALLKATLNF